MNKSLKRVLKILSIGSLIISCDNVVAMYGVPVDIDTFKAVKIKNEENVALKGLSVKLIQNNDTLKTEITNNDGVASFSYDFYENENYSVLIKDIDGEENFGKYEIQQINLTEPDTTFVTMKKQ